jgi:hypothetical protein
MILIFPEFAIQNFNITPGYQKRFQVFFVICKNQRKIWLQHISVFPKF